MIEQELPVHVLSSPPLTNYTGTVDLRRFSRYWRKVEKRAYP